MHEQRFRNPSRSATRQRGGLLLACLLALPHLGAATAPADEVNVMIGTTGPKIKYGGLCPWVTPPFGMTQWTPMSQENGISRMAYRSEATSLMGFMGSHQPTVWMGDYGFITLMPEVGAPRLAPADRLVPKVPGSEQAHPYCYAVRLKAQADATIGVRFTALSHSALFEVDYPQQGAAGLMLELSRLTGYAGAVKIDPARGEITGWNSGRHNTFRGKHMGPELKNFRGYFVIRFEHPAARMQTWRVHGGADVEAAASADYEMTREVRITGARVGAWVDFATATGGPVRFKIGSSFISVDQARANLAAEIPDWDFARVEQANRAAWNASLQRIQVEGASPDDRAILYTAMYHSLLFPREFSEQGKYYSPFDEKIHAGTSYNDYSMWDTFRALHPLLTLIAPERVSPMIQSLVQMYQQGGWIPKWPNPTYTNIMIGTPADAIIADAYLKGFRDFDVPAAYAAVRKDAMVPPEGDRDNRWADRADWRAYEARGGLTYYKTLGYIPADKANESVSRTLEDAYADYCVARFAQALGHDDDAKMFFKRAANYAHLYDPARGFMWPRLADGLFYDGDPAHWRAFTEGSPWTYLFCVMQDVPGLIKLMGRDKFIARLDENFSGGHYAYDNEPENHYPYLYDWVGQPWQTQRILTDAVRRNYANTPDGITGNDDCGQMSAWYLFAAMGFYPVAPASGEYAIGRPFFPRLELHLQRPFAHTLNIRAENFSPENIYVRSVTLDGQPVDRPFLRHEELVHAHTLVFTMTSKPGEWKLRSP